MAIVSYILLLVFLCCFASPRIVRPQIPRLFRVLLVLGLVLWHVQIAAVLIEDDAALLHHSTSPGHEPITDVRLEELTGPDAAVLPVVAAGAVVVLVQHDLASSPAARCRDKATGRFDFPVEVGALAAFEAFVLGTAEPAVGTFPFGVLFQKLFTL